ncbi:MAG: hypothetical protein RJB66_1409 [Pseudomonadota bacterium]|jgi:NTP pyrophosphatase (non-canonical NTP hydrolase)
MHPNEYVKNVLVTESNNFDVIGARFNVSDENKETSSQAIRNIRLLHATMGICTEVGELFEFLEKANLDFTNLKEEVGDAFWYCGIAIDELNLNLEHMVLEGKSLAHSFQETSETAKRAHLVNLLSKATKESSVLLDLLKKSAFYGKTLDQDKFNLVITHFVGSMMAVLALGGFTVEEAMEVNIAKLRKRYGDKFTEAAAITRNLEAERKILEGQANA